MSKNIKELEQEEEALARAVRSSAQQIWQAGLGAFAKAQAEGGREFTRLVRDGSELQKRARQVEDATDTVARKAERASRRTSASQLEPRNGTGRCSRNGWPRARPSACRRGAKSKRWRSGSMRSNGRWPSWRPNGDRCRP
ncbi:phasin family protein [Massilia sp. Dwa41.01b]|uniref:phasin family protein n=1 Tax=Massilia sp. Dwa41.01b TaxID=2709302 RepID=UPI0015FF0680|nr:phasin family protein [Massilia sp. Dwa41.01b]QNA88579.1 phasin family protein [Massilia sp. Dwa41.01b]